MDRVAAAAPAGIVRRRAVPAGIVRRAHRRANKLAKALEGVASVEINAEKPRKGAFVITANGKTVVELLDMPRPFPKLKALVRGRTEVHGSRRRRGDVRRSAWTRRRRGDVRDSGGTRRRRGDVRGSGGTRRRRGDAADRPWFQLGGSRRGGSSVFPPRTCPQDMEQVAKDTIAALN